MKNQNRNNSPSFLTFIMVGLAFLVTVLITAAQQTAAKTLCSDSTGVFLGLATDEFAYETVAGGNKGGGPDDEAENEPQSWTMTSDASDAHSGKPPTGPTNSYDGRFLQVLPDSGRSYPGRGGHLKHAAQLDDVDIKSPYVNFNLRVDREHAGIHTLFLRWTGGDTVGGGDSLYVVLYKKESKSKRTLVHGQQTVKPAVVPIDAGMSRYAGCCYDMVTHACPCFSEVPTNATCPTERFIDRVRASTFGVQCLVGGGAMTIVKAPEWYLYAGQEAGDVMDFDSEPWDVTCEADGSNTRDSGHDFPSWVLEKGEYDLRIYAREDGTALDAIYVAGPRGRAPTVSRRYAKGDSTICVTPSLGAGKVVGFAAAGLCVVLLVWFASTRPGKEILGTVLSKPAQAVRYVYIDNS